MLFTYTYVPHSVEKMQKFIDFIFFEVWCKAPMSKTFSFDLFNGNKELKDLMIKMYYDDTDIGYFFYNRVEKIFILFSELDVDAIDQLKSWYNANNNIEQACTNKDTDIARYSDIQKVNENLGNILKDFFSNLWGKSVLGKAAIESCIGAVTDHYNAFVTKNNRGVCPFCGIDSILGFDLSKRNAYDHYLPKSEYPFNSVNIKNIAPSCHCCNSSYKLAKDPIHKNGIRRKAFYPFSTQYVNINIFLTYKNTCVQEIKKDDIRLQFTSDDFQEEIATWLDLYRIEERYQDVCRSSGKEWFVEINDEWVEYMRSKGEDGSLPQRYLSALNRSFQRAPYRDHIFLKKAFLDACNNLGLFNTSPSAS